MSTNPYSLTANVEITRLCGQRDRAIELIHDAVQRLSEGHALALQARKLITDSGGAGRFRMRDRREDEHYSRLFLNFDSDRSLDVFRQHVDASLWLHLLEESGMERLMDTTARKSFLEGLQTDAPEVTEENVYTLLQKLHASSGLIFQRGLAATFSQLDRRFRSHDAFKLGSRIILTRLIDDSGWLRRHGDTAKMLTDVERSLAVLDGQDPEPDALMDAILEARGGAFAKVAAVAETRYFRVRTYKNGNAHLWFTRDDLIQQANELLAEYYGAVLPDAVPAEAFVMGTELSRDLAFYATPPKVVQTLLSHQSVRGLRVLEPSAGTGNIAKELLRQGATVDAIEVHPGRVSELRSVRGLSVRQANFLHLTPSPIYDLVAMNPPFSGTHWMNHVYHAFSFLKPGGVLRAVVPATAELGTTKRHLTFRNWLEKHDGYMQHLPAESFASSGTRVNTNVLTLRAPR